MQPFDDRLEEPEGLEPQVVAPAHPCVAGLPTEWPALLGLNEVVVKDGATLVAQAGDRPLLVADTFGQGRSIAWTSDVGPHWCPPEFLAWPGYGRLWHNLVSWLAKQEAQ
jgi:uncharacterized membrane protein